MAFWVVAKFAAVAVQARVFVFLSFDGARFSTVGTVRNGVIDQSAEELIPKFGAGPFGAGLAHGQAELAQAVESALEADPIDGRLVCRGGLGGNEADEIVSDEVEMKFLFDHFWGLTREHFHAQSGLKIIEAQFQAPALSIGLEDLVGRVV